MGGVVVIEGGAVYSKFPVPTPARETVGAKLPSGFLPYCQPELRTLDMLLHPAVEGA